MASTAGLTSAQDIELVSLKPASELPHHLSTGALCTVHRITDTRYHIRANLRDKAVLFPFRVFQTTVLCGALRVLALFR